MYADNPYQLLVVAILASLFTQRSNVQQPCSRYRARLIPPNDDGSVDVQETKQVKHHSLTTPHLSLGLCLGRSLHLGLGLESIHQVLFEGNGHICKSCEPTYEQKVDVQGTPSVQRWMSPFNISILCPKHIRTTLSVCPDNGKGRHLNN